MKAVKEFDQILFCIDENFLTLWRILLYFSFNDKMTFITRRTIAGNRSSNLIRLENHSFVALMDSHVICLLSKIVQELIVLEKFVNSLIF